MRDTDGLSIDSIFVEAMQNRLYNLWMLTQKISLPASYLQLRQRVREALLFGKKKIEQQKVLTYWETGQVIHDHILKNKKPGYGEHVLLRLSEDLEIDLTLLKRVLKFARVFPKSAGRHFLSWSHYRTLIMVEDKDKRLALEERAAKFSWPSQVLEERVKYLNSDKSKAYELLNPVKGSPYTYRIVQAEKINPGKSDLWIDHGFSNYKEADMQGAVGLAPGDIIISEWVKGDTYRLRKVEGKTSADLFTYYAYIERVVDGDTLRVQIDMGFGEWTRQYLRLRGIDAPEIITSAGKRAKRFVESELTRVPFILITTSRSDKYDRYLADVFYKSKSGEQLLNNRLLEEKLAQRM